MRTECPNCHQKYELDDAYQDTVVECEECHSNFTARNKDRPGSPAPSKTPVPAKVASLLSSAAPASSASSSNPAPLEEYRRSWLVVVVSAISWVTILIGILWCVVGAKSQARGVIMDGVYFIGAGIMVACTAALVNYCAQVAFYNKAMLQEIRTIAGKR